MEKTKTTIPQYIESLPVDKKDTIKKLDDIISAAIPSVKKVMWEGKFWGGSEQKIIGYGDLEYKRSDKEIVKWFIVGLALQKNYITIFVSATDGKLYLAEKYKDELGKVKVGRSSISFKKLEDLNIEKLAELVKEAFVG